MHQHWDSCGAFAARLRELLPEYFSEEFEPLVDLALFPAQPYLSLIGSMLQDSVVFLGAQDVSAHKEGPFTGEVSAEMLADVASDYCIVGHSERRFHAGETSPVLALKLKQLRVAEIIPVLCVGEGAVERDAGLAAQFVIDQLDSLAEELKETTPDTLVLAYEPIWAIGTGNNAEPASAQEMAAYIRQWLASTLGAAFADQVPVLYGGSVNPGNIQPYLEQPDIDGALIGGASLEADSFAAMAQTAIEVCRRQH
jgi:triosephosphate isomerase